MVAALYKRLIGSRHSSKVLPYLGLGLSTNLGERDRPDPLALAASDPGLLDFVEYSAPLSLADCRRLPRFEALLAARRRLPMLYHPVHLNLWGPEVEQPEALLQLGLHVEEVRSPWVGNDVAWWHVQGREFPGFLYVAPPLDDTGLAQAAAHAVRVQAALNCPLALENPTVVALRGARPGETGGRMHVLEFMGRLSERTGCDLILDLGHLLAYQLASGQPLERALGDDLERALAVYPLDRVIEIHLAGGVVTGQAYFDDHSQPVREELFGLLERLLPRCTGLRAVTFEGDGHPDGVAAITLRRLRALVAPPGDQTSEGPPDIRSVPPLDADLSGCWEVFDRAMGRVDDDAPGAAAEVEMRLAVLAERLDRELPLTRALAAPDTEGLLAFQRSQEFRDAYNPQRPELPAAFGAFVRRRLLASPDEVLAAVLGFELLSGSGSTSFPFDMSELRFAHAAMRRHFAGRAPSVGVFPAAAVEALRQVAARAVKILPRRSGGAGGGGNSSAGTPGG
jgi:uncharacterized protein (UPF0276 family)